MTVMYLFIKMDKQELERLLSLVKPQQIQEECIDCEYEVIESVDSKSKTTA